MSHNRSPPQTAAGPPILDCPTCSPKRPMILKNVKGSFRSKRPTVIYECTQCGAIQAGPPALFADLAKEAGPQPTAGIPNPPED